MRPSSDAGNKRSGSRYVLGDLLGRGGMAEVFAGYAVGDHGFQKPVAIKRLLPELANDEVFVERLIEEAKLLVGMQHGHIVSVLDLAREGDDVFLVMEFVDGPSLRQLIKARGARGLSLGVATYILQSAAAGLEFAHARPGGAIIHADISPSNLLLTTSGEVRVADFGIARREGLGHGVVEGKWAYMAPEQARGEALTPRSDVFALGVVFYELLTGQHPFGRAVTPTERDQQIQIIPPRVVKPSIPPGLDAICMRALAHSPRDRYARMQQLIDALVEERFTTGLREGAADLAQAIREVAPKSDVVGAPRTMHTDRPVTLMTRSLLRDVTPARRPSRPSRPSSSPVPPPAAPLELPSSDEFAVQPTMALTSAIPTEALADEFPQPPSGAQTVARMVDQVALAQAAQAAQAMLARPPMLAAPAMPPGMPPAMPPGMSPAMPAMMPPGMPPMMSPAMMSPAMMQVAQAAQAMLAAPAMAAFNPAALRADGTPMPPFRASHSTDMRGEELASVVGGHTVSHGGGLAVESRYRWPLVVLGMAALIGVVAAIVIQLAPTERVEAAPDRSQVVRPADERARVAPATDDPAARGAQGPGGDPAPRAGESAWGSQAIGEDGKAVDGRSADGKQSDRRSADGTPADGTPTDGNAVDGRSAGGNAADGRSAGGNAADGQAGDGKSGDGKSGDGKSADGKSVDGKSADGKSADGKSADGKSVDGRASDGKPVDGKSVDGKSVDGNAVNARSGDGRSANSNAADSRLADGRSTGGTAVNGRSGASKSVDGNAADGRSDGKPADNRLVDAKTGGKSADGDAAESRIVFAKTLDRSAGDGKSGDGKSSDGKSSGRSGEPRSSDGRSGSIGRRAGAGHHKGILNVQSTPWSWVTVDVETKETPAKFYLDPGLHTVKLYNEDNGRVRYVKVTIEPDKMYRLDPKMD